MVKSPVLIAPVSKWTAAFFNGCCWDSAAQFRTPRPLIRMAAMNAMLRGFDHSPIVRRNSICDGEDRWDEVRFDVRMENPPFSGQRGDANSHIEEMRELVTEENEK